MKRKKTDTAGVPLVDIPPEELGPGCMVDLRNNRLKGVSGKIYEDVMVNRDDLMRLIGDLKKNNALGIEGAVEFVKADNDDMLH